MAKVIVTHGGCGGESNIVTHGGGGGEGSFVGHARVCIQSMYLLQK